jgi:hypothetical protein
MAAMEVFGGLPSRFLGLPVTVLAAAIFDFAAVALVVVFGRSISQMR